MFLVWETVVRVSFKVSVGWETVEKVSIKAPCRTLR